MGRSPIQYLTYQHNVQRFFREHSENYGGVIIPLSIAVSYPSGTYGFVRALCARDNSKKYAIDPRTPLFQKSWNRENVRPPHRKMAKLLGGPFNTKGLTSQIEEEDFDEEAIKLVTENCLKFQSDFHAREEDTKKLEKYKKLLGLTEMGALGSPQFLIPPYFQTATQNDAWYRINLKCIEEALKLGYSLPIRPILHLQNLTTQFQFQNFYSFLKEQSISEFWLYPNNFKEHEADKDELKIYRGAFKLARENSIKPYVLFGGYFSILMSYFGLFGFGNGVGYGEWRDSGYHRGGSPENRIYILKLHRYLDAPRAQALIETDPEYFGMDTELISECIEAKRPLQDLTQAECLDHFMECRKLELEFVQSHDLNEAIEEFNITYSHLKDLEKKEYGSSLMTWLEVLQDESTPS